MTVITNYINKKKHLSLLGHNKKCNRLHLKTIKAFTKQDGVLYIKLNLQQNIYIHTQNIKNLFFFFKR